MWKINKIPKKNTDNLVTRRWGVEEYEDYQFVLRRQRWNCLEMNDGRYLPEITVGNHRRSWQGNCNSSHISTHDMLKTLLFSVAQAHQRGPFWN